MKNLLLTTALLLTVSFVTASNGSDKIISNEISTFTNGKLLLFKPLRLNKKHSISPKCTVTCTAVLSNGTTYTTTAGNWFTSCKKAETKCKAKLFDLIFHQ